MGCLFRCKNATTQLPLYKAKVLHYLIIYSVGYIDIIGGFSMSGYINKVIENLKFKNSNEPLFLQTAEEVLSSLSAVVDKHPEYEAAAILERLTEPERIITFRVTWIDDNGVVNVNRGYRVQFNSAIGPYKGGLRFQSNVTLDTLKFLGFEQIFKNSLTTLPIGGAKGGSDFDPKGRSDGEIMRFCQAFVTELYRHIGADIDVPAGDMGVGAREIGYMYGQYKRICGGFENGVFTGKGLSYGGSLIRPEATGYGLVYYMTEALKDFGDSFAGKTVAVSGYGNVAWGACKKIAELGGRVVCISGRNGYVYDPDGVITKKKLDAMLELRASKNATVKDYADRFGCEFFPGEKPWGVKVDIALPCATQNEIGLEEAKMLVSNGVMYYAEGANMPATNEAVKYMQKHMKIVAPAKASNAGGVAVSALEMCQNSMRYSWSAQEVEEKLSEIMKNVYHSCVNAANEYGLDYDLVAGANIAGFLKVADAMIAQGIN